MPNERLKLVESPAPLHEPIEEVVEVFDTEMTFYGRRIFMECRPEGANRGNVEEFREVLNDYRQRNYPPS